MVLWALRGSLIGALIGCLLMVAVGYLFGAVMGTLVSLPSMGNPERVRSEALKLAGYGAVVGVVVGSVTGCLMGLFGHVRVVAIGAAVGALSFGLGGAALGSVTVNDIPVDKARLMILTLVGAMLGVVVGGAIGWMASPLDKYLMGKLR